MNHQITILHPDERGSGASRTTSVFPRDLYNQVRKRVRLLAVLAGAGFALRPAVFLLIVGASLISGELPPDAWDGVGFMGIHAGAIVLSAVLWYRARDPDTSPEQLLTLGLLYQVAVCLIIGVLRYWSDYLEYGYVPRLTWIPVAVVLFPLVVPGPPRRMLWGAIAAGAMAPVSLVGLHVAGAIVVPPDVVLSAILNSGLAVAFAYFGARTVYGLGKQVAEARRMGSYQLEERLGVGGMGEVWRARHRLLARPAAIKLIRPEVLQGQARGSQMAVTRFEREAQATAGLRSPHTVELYDFGVADDGTFYYVMELLDGLDAASLVERFGPLSAGRTVYILAQVCRSLSEAHARGLVHRDIKPANIYVCRYGEDVDFVKVLDFGLVKHTNDGAGAGVQVTSEFAGGTPAFIAPEQALGYADIDRRADIYALGCVAYWLLTGRYVFEGKTPMEMIARHVNSRPVPISERAQTPVPESLERVIMACLEKAPEKRPAHAREVMERLAQGMDEGIWTQGNAMAWWSAHVPLSDAAS